MYIYIYTYGRENGGNVILVWSIASGSRLGWAMNLVDWLHTSADEQVLSGRRAVVICVMGCLRGFVVLHRPFVSKGPLRSCAELLQSCVLCSSDQCRAVKLLEVRNVVWLRRTKEKCKPSLSATAPCTFAAAPSFQACLRAFKCTFCMRVCIYVYVYMCADMYICMYMHVCMYLYIYAFIHMCMCMCVHICA